MNNNDSHAASMAAHLCEECGEHSLTRSMQDQTFAYGCGEDAAELHALVPVWSCSACGDAFTDGEAEIIRHAVVCRHLGRLTPAEVKAVRQAVGPSQEAFASLTGLGLASIKRWEGGNQIQSLSVDRYLRMLQVPEAVHHLRAVAGNAPDERFAGVVRGIAESASVVATRSKTFRTELSGSVRARASTFELRPTRELAEA